VLEPSCGLQILFPVGIDCCAAKESVDLLDQPCKYSNVTRYEYLKPTAFVIAVHRDVGCEISEENLTLLGRKDHGKQPPPLASLQLPPSGLEFDPRT